MLFAARDFLLRVQTRGELSITAKNVFLPTEQWAPFCARGGTALRSRFWSGRGEKPEVLGQENSAPRRAPRRAARFVAPRPACIRSILQKSKRKQTRTRLRAAAQRRRRWGSGSDPPRFCRPLLPPAAAQRCADPTPGAAAIPAYPAAPERSAAAAPQELNFKANQIPIGHCILSQQSSFDTSLIQKGAFQTPFLSFLPATL